MINKPSIMAGLPLSKCAELTPLAKYQEDKAAIQSTINLLRHLGGHLDHNVYKDTIIRLEGILRGMRMCEMEVNL